MSYYLVNSAEARPPRIVDGRIVPWEPPKPADVHRLIRKLRKGQIADCKEGKG